MDRFEILFACSFGHIHVLVAETLTSRHYVIVFARFYWHVWYWQCQLVYGKSSSSCYLELKGCRLFLYLWQTEGNKHLIGGYHLLVQKLVKQTSQNVISHIYHWYFNQIDKRIVCTFYVYASFHAIFRVSEIVTFDMTVGNTTIQYWVLA